MTTKQLAILNSLVTFAAENVPGGLSPEETEIARIVGGWARGWVAPEEQQVFEYAVVKAATGKAMEVVANQWATKGWRVVGVVGGSTTGGGNQFILERPRGEVRTEMIRLEVDLEKIFHAAVSDMPHEELRKLIEDIEKEHGQSP